MKIRRISFSLFMALMLALPAVFTSASAQDASQNQASALMRGYRTGYSDGYPAGVQDSAKRASETLARKPSTNRPTAHIHPLTAVWTSIEMDIDRVSKPATARVMTVGTSIQRFPTI